MPQAVFKRRVLLSAAACATAWASACSAETLADAIALAYQSNPQLQSQRAQLRAVDEGYVQARAGYRPSASVELDGQYSHAQQAGFFGGGRTDTETNTGAATLTVIQPLYTGGRTARAVDAADADIRAGREALRAAEAQTLQTVIQAYMDVRRDRQALAIRQKDVGVLQGQLDDADARFKAGEVTRTDVEQSRAQLAGARALLSLAQGQLQVSRAAYAATVGQNPGDLAPEPALPGMPSSVDEAFDLALDDSPQILRAQITEQASRARLSEAKAEYGPSVQLRGSFGYSGGPLGPFNTSKYERAATATAVLTQPLLTGGINASNVRRQRELNNSDRIQIEATRRTVIETVSQAWNQMLAARASAVSDEEQVRAARAYFADTQEEYRVGQHSTLDVLIAEQTLRDAELSLVSARRDEYVAGAAVLGAIGRLEAGRLIEGAPLYDPAKAFKRVKHASAVPYEALIEGADRIGAPEYEPPRRLAAPAFAAGAVIQTARTGVPDPAAPATRSPTAPLKRSTSPATPPPATPDPS